jgi:ABC-2 type transport system permease protein
MTVSVGVPLEVPAVTRRSSVVRYAGMVAHQVRYDLITLVRNRSAQFFTLGMPIAFLVLFAAMFGNNRLHVNGHIVPGTTYYVASLSAFTIVNVAFQTLLIVLVDLRESGVLRRRRATPQPAWTIVAGRAATSFVTAIATSGLLLIIGRLAYGVSLPLSSVPALVVSMLVGVVVFTSLGFAVAGMVRSFQAAQPVAMALALPSFFISGVFVPWSLVPHALQLVAEVFPIRPLALSMLDPYIAHGVHSPWDPSGLAVLAGWGVFGVVMALRRFKWAPQFV